MREVKLGHDERAERLVVDLDAAKLNVKIFAGELNIQVYGQPAVEQAFRMAHARRVTIEVMAGPVLSVDDNGESPVIGLAQEGAITLYCRPFRHTREHFRVVDDGARFYQESPHPPLQPGLWQDLSIPDTQLWVDKALADFERFKRCFYLKGVRNPEFRFVCVTPDELRIGLEAVRRQRGDFDYLTADELREYVLQARSKLAAH